MLNYVLNPLMPAIVAGTFLEAAFVYLRIRLWKLGQPCNDLRCLEQGLRLWRLISYAFFSCFVCSICAAAADVVAIMTGDVSDDTGWRLYYHAALMILATLAATFIARIKCQRCQDLIIGRTPESY